MAAVRPSPASRLRVRLLGAAGALAGLLLAGIAAASPAPLGPETGQLLLVLSPGWDQAQGRLYRFQRDAQGQWQQQGEGLAVSLGRNGSAWGSGLHPEQGLPEGPRKREGDGRSPAGVFAIGPAFGYARNHGFRMPYLPMDAQHWCVDVPESPLYNTIVDTREVGAAAVAGSSEPMRRDLHLGGDMVYRLGFVIAHNPDNVPGAGSCIFAHLRRAPGDTTAGCTALDAPDMDALMQWIDPAQAPRLVLLPQAAYAGLRQAWQLPAVTP